MIHLLVEQYLAVFLFLLGDENNSKCVNEWMTIELLFG